VPAVGVCGLGRRGLAMALAVTAAAGLVARQPPAALNPRCVCASRWDRTQSWRDPRRKLPGLSPDGTLLAAIVSGADGETRLARAGSIKVRLHCSPATRMRALLLFSGCQWIAFHADRKIKKISVRGGAAVTLCDAAGAIAGSWGDDGNIIVHWLGDRSLEDFL